MSALAKAREDLNKVADELDRHVVDLIAEGGKHVHAGAISGLVGAVRLLVDGLEELERDASANTDAFFEQAARDFLNGHKA